MVDTTSLTAYWKLDEASGTRNDSHGSNHLTDNNTVTAATAKLGTYAAEFTPGNQEYLSLADNADLSVSDIDFAFSLWLYIYDATGTYGILSKDGSNGATGGCYELRLGDTSRRLTWLIRQSGGGDCARVTADNFGNLSSNTWYHVVVWHDAVNNVAGISINGTANTVSTTGTPFDNGGIFALGAHSYLSQYYNGRIDEVGFWKRMLTSQERSDLYNGGAGLAYPFTTTSQKTINGLAKASVKTVNGVAIASEKTWNGLS